MTRLVFRIYLAFVAIVAAFFVLSALLWWLGGGRPEERELLAGSAALAEAALPPPGAPSGELREKLDQLAASLGASLAVFDAEGHPLARSGRAVPAPDVARRESYWIHRHGPPLAALRLADGRWAVVRSHRGPPFGWHGLVPLVLLAVVLGLGAYPLARGIAGRLEELERAVDGLGAGDLAARVPVRGRDEVARLARRFNRAAERIESLVRGQRALLASASHELRSPLARMRVAAELLGERGGEAGRALRDQLARDVERLDEAIDELLAVSRLDLLEATEAHARVDLLDLAAEEAAREGAAVEGVPAPLRGDARSLRHLIRNLLANARRHAPGAPPEVSVSRGPDGAARLCVADRGPGVPEAERGRIFEPFVRAAAPGPAEGGPGADAPGVGLGLAIVREIARHHGGAVRCLARDGGGSIFEVVLPGRPARPQEAAP